MKATLNIREIEGRSDMRRAVLTLVWPLIVQNLLFTLYFFTDRLMVGRLGEAALAAVGIAGPLLWSISMVLMVG